MIADGEPASEKPAEQGETAMKVMVVTGASRGIGAAAARLAGRAGYAVCVNYNTHGEEAEAVVADIAREGGRALAVKADMAEERDIVALFEAADRLGPLAALVNNAGYLGGESLVEDYDVAAMRRLWDVNVVACFVCAREAIRRMSTRRGGEGGAIVNVSSMAADHGGVGPRVHYATSKGALVTFTRGLAKQVGPDGIRVNAVMPGAIDTHFNDDYDNAGRNRRFMPNIPLGRVGVAEDVAPAIVWLASDEARYVTGESVRVNGGMF
jgi:NAD(P)-dependent dehydrogenase (short-subunit alcohol dehydrogenase family)